MLIWIGLSRVSIHAPREGCDYLSIVKASTARVSIHAPREGCDANTSSSVRSEGMFQFTHPGRGATASVYSCFKECHSFNSRTPGGVRLHGLSKVQAYQLFQFTHPGRGATRRLFGCNTYVIVSIHAPREGCDYRFNPFRLLAYQFQFTHPGRVATRTQPHIDIEVRVSIHAPREGFDLSISHINVFSTVSIHAPREGCDSVVQSCVLWGG